MIIDAMTATDKIEYYKKLLELERRTLESVTEQRDRLAEALEKLAGCDFIITLPDRMDAVRDIAREALAAVEGGRP